MKVVITAAGHSKRFRLQGFLAPKFTLEVFNKSIMEQVLSMFSSSDDFMIVTNSKIYGENSEFFGKLKERWKKLQITLIQEHDGGPVTSLLCDEVQEWLGNEPFIVSYCDFFIDWNYFAFLGEVIETEADGCIVTFSGVQSASRGKTLFAYLRTDGKNVLEVREKRSFSSLPRNELTSAGIYYFKNPQMFREYCRKANVEFQNYSEKYVSLVFNPMIQDGLIVTHYECEYFVGLGTPEDYRELKYWETYFKECEKNSEIKLISNKIIPMAGSGERFRKAYVNVPKPIIPIRQKPMFFQALESIPRAQNNILLVSSDVKARVETSINNQDALFGKVEILEISGKTKGPGATLLQFDLLLENLSDVIVSSCDYFHSIEIDDFIRLKSIPDIDVIVLYSHFSEYRMRNAEAFAYCDTNQKGQVLRIVEKQLLSESPEQDKLLVGSFWFRQGESLKLALEETFKQKKFVKGELFVGSALNYLIKNGYNVFALPVKHWVSFGDPEELDIYHWWEDVYELFSTVS